MYAFICNAYSLFLLEIILLLIYLFMFSSYGRLTLDLLLFSWSIYTCFLYVMIDACVCSYIYYKYECLRACVRIFVNYTNLFFLCQLFMQQIFVYAFSFRRQ